MCTSRRKVSIFLIFVSLLLMSELPSLIGRFYFVENGRSTNDTLVFLVFPALTMNLMLFLPVFGSKFTPDLVNFDLTFEQKPYTKIRWFFLLIISAFLASVLTGLISEYTGLERLTFIYIKDRSHLNFGFFWVEIVTIVLFVPIVEEVFWRGYAQDQLNKCFGKWAALFLQAFLFGLVHMYPVLGFVTVFFYGLIFGYWRMKRRKLIPIIIAHIVLNGLWVLGHYPDLYEMSKVNIAFDYVEEINKIGNVPVEDNAAPYYTRAAELLAKRPDGLFDIRNICWITELSSQEQDLLKKWLSDNEAALAEIRAGTQKRFYQPKYSGASVLEMDGPAEHMYAKFLDLGMAMYWNAVLLAGEGKTDESMNELISCYRLSCHIMSGPKPVHELVTGMALKRKSIDTPFLLIDKLDWDAEQLEKLQTAIEGVAKFKESTPDIRCEKMNLYDIIQRVFTDDSNGDGHIPKDELEEIKKSETRKFLAPDLTEDKINKWAQLTRKRTEELVEELFIFYKDALSKSPAQLHSEGIDIDSMERELIGNNIINLYLPPISKIHQIFYQNNTCENALLTTIGIFRYNLEHDKFPEKLDVLITEGLINSLPIDPYSDQPLIYKTADDSFMLYSIGRDFDNDGGKHDKHWGKEDGDYVFWPLEMNSNKN